MVPSYSCMVPALFLAKMPCTESGTGEGGKSQVPSPAGCAARSILPHGASSGPCGMFRVMPAGSPACPRPWQLCWDSWREKQQSKPQAVPGQHSVGLLSSAYLELVLICNSLIACNDLGLSLLRS